VRAAAAAVVVVCLTAAACGGSNGDASPGGGGQPAAGTLEALWRAPGADVALVAGTSDYQTGKVRYSFLVVDRQGRAHFSDSAKIWVARGLAQKPFAETQARLETIAVPGSKYQADAPQLFVADLDLPTPGKYWVLAEPEGGTKIQGLGQLEVRTAPEAPAIGARAPVSDTPTLRSTGGDVDALTTRNPPDRDLLRWSVADSLRAHVPFVVAFATPAFCQSRTCGPVVDIVEEVGKRLRSTPVRFIHVEIYADNDPAKGENRWVRQWKLPTEPWTFLVGRDGRIKDRFEGAYSADELERAVRSKLLPS
jgi:hypothetical protein